MQSERQRGRTHRFFGPAGSVEECKTAYAFCTRIDAGKYIIAHFNSCVLGARFTLREVKDIRLFIVEVSKHFHNITFLGFFARYAVRMNGFSPVFTTITNHFFGFDNSR